MPELIINGKIERDDWQYLARAEDPARQTIPEGKVVIHLATWQAQNEQIGKSRQENLGIWLDSDDEPDTIDDPNQFALIAVNFPKFVDGRGYSTARLLRERYLFTGELRAMGDVLLDQLFYMKRCGFNSFALRPDRSATRALAGLTVFSECYQGATDEPMPLFRRRLR